MALKSTIYKVNLSIADIDHNYYADHALTLARHPSETDERMMIRLLALAVHAHELHSVCNGDGTLAVVREAFQALGLWKPPVVLPYVKLVADPADMPFFERTKDLELAEDIRDYFFRLLGPLHALQAAYPKIDVSHLIKSFEVHAGVDAGCNERFRDYVQLPPCPA